MNRKEHLLTILSEECNEVAQRASKCLRFGVSEIQPGQPLTNAQRLRRELHDLIAVAEMLADEGHLEIPPDGEFQKDKEDKKDKIEKFLRYSEQCGTLDAVGAPPPKEGETPVNLGTCQYPGSYPCCGVATKKHDNLVVCDAHYDKLNNSIDEEYRSYQSFTG